MPEVRLKQLEKNASFFCHQHLLVSGETVSIFNSNPPVKSQVSSFNMLPVSFFFFFQSRSLATSVPSLDPEPVDGSKPIHFYHGFYMGTGHNLLGRIVFPVGKIGMVRGEQSNQKQTLVCSLEAKGSDTAPTTWRSYQLSLCVSWNPVAHP